MNYTKLGSTGLKVSPIGLGSALFGNTKEGYGEITPDIAHQLLDKAWSAGINFIDTADVYGRPNTGRSEKIIGDWLQDHDREEFVIASKVGDPFEESPNQKGLSRKHIRTQIRGTLDRLGTDYLDIYYIHSWDNTTPIEETLNTLHQLVVEGKVHYLGASRLAAWQLIKALWKSDCNDLERFEIVQPRFNAAHREEVKEYLDVCADQNLAVCPYGPLEGGFLTGKYSRDNDAPSDSRADNREWEIDQFSERQWKVLEKTRKVANELGVTPTQVSLRWLIEQNRFTCVPIVGARTPDQLEENLGALEISLDDTHFEHITEAYTT